MKAITYILGLVAISFMVSGCSLFTKTVYVPELYEAKRPPAPAECRKTRRDYPFPVLRGEKRQILDDWRAAKAAHRRVLNDHMVCSDHAARQGG